MSCVYTNLSKQFYLIEPSWPVVHPWIIHPYVVCDHTKVCALNAVGGKSGGARKWIPACHDWFFVGSRIYLLHLVEDAEWRDLSHVLAAKLEADLCRRPCCWVYAVPTEHQEGVKQIHCDLGKNCVTDWWSWWSHSIFVRKNMTRCKRHGRCELVQTSVWLGRGAGDSFQVRFIIRLCHCLSLQ